MIRILTEPRDFVKFNERIIINLFCLTSLALLSKSENFNLSRLGFLSSRKKTGHERLCWSVKNRCFLCLLDLLNLTDVCNPSLQCKVDICFKKEQNFINHEISVFGSKPRSVF